MLNSQNFVHAMNTNHPGRLLFATHALLCLSNTTFGCVTSSNYDIINPEHDLLCYMSIYTLLVDKEPLCLDNTLVTHILQVDR